MQGGFFILVRKAAVVWERGNGVRIRQPHLSSCLFFSPLLFLYSLPLLYVSLIIIHSPGFSPLLIINFFPREKFGVMAFCAGFGFWDLLSVVGSERGGLGFEGGAGGKGGVMYRYLKPQFFLVGPTVL